MARLERGNLHLKLGMLALLAVVAALACLAATNPVAKVVRAQRFEVVNPKGLTCAHLGLERDGTYLWLCDKDGTRGRAILSVLANGNSILTLTDKGGTERVHLFAPADRRPELRLLDKDGQTALWRAAP